MLLRLAAAAALAAAALAVPSSHPQIIREDPEPGKDAQAVPEGYRDLANITAVMREWADAHPDRALLMDITDEFNGGRKTAEGRGIFALKVSDNVAEEEDEPNVLMTGCLHAQELQTPEAILMMAEVLLLASDSRPESAALLQVGRAF